MTRPNIQIPKEFAINGEKADFTQEKIQTGFDKLNPDIFAGDNANKFIDDTYKGLNGVLDLYNGIVLHDITTTYDDKAVVGKFIENSFKLYHSLVNDNTGHEVTETEYWEEVALGGGGGLEVCDIGMALYIDETKGLRRYLNGQIVDINTNTQAFLNRLKEITTLHPSLLCTEEEWQTAKTMSAFGQVGKFVFNYSSDEIVSVRLPRVVNVQGLFDLQNLGMTVEAGLPDHSHSYRTKPYTGGDNSGGDPFNIGNEYIQTGLASASNPIYGKSNTVQPEAIQYPYFIQIATGSETEANIVNTLENVNGFTLLESKYSDKPLYNESWLLSNGQWNAKAVYPTVYEALQVEYNSEIEAGTTVTLPSGVSYTKRGLSVKLSTETYTDYDFVLNTAEESFRLPLKTLHTDNTVDSLSLYYYVGDIDQNHGIVNMGRIGEVLANKQDKCIHIIDTYVNGSSWYRVYSDGWCEQGGYVTSASVTLLKPYINTSFHVMVADGTNSGSTSCTNVTITDRSKLSFFISWCAGAWWEAKGYIS